MYQTGPTIKQTLDDILSKKIVLPAIQREFVWWPTQICRLFDSLMQGYPFNTFLYWQVAPENSGKFQFYDFVLNYHQRDNPHCPRLPEMPNKQLTAVLDGQQRLTALNIGLRGSMARKLPRLRWSNSQAFPTCKLYLDLLWQPDENDEGGLKYRFNFLKKEQVKTAETNDEVCWFPVSEVLAMVEPYQVSEWLFSAQLAPEHSRRANRTLHNLYDVVHNKHLIAFYEERSQELDRVLQIFIRTNSGGTMLSYSDLLLSVAVAQWKKHDAREEIHSLVDELNGIGSGFLFSKDLVLKAGLLLSDIGNVGFKVDNFGQSNMAKFESKWDDIKNALLLAVQLVSDFGFNSQNLTATNAILPIAYYLHKRKPVEAYLTSSHFKDDREAIRVWLIRSLLKGVWGGASDTLMTALRQIIRDRNGVDFPLEQMMTGGGRSLVFDDEEIEDLADMRYGNRLTFALLSLLFPHVDLRNHFHVDHIFPKARFTRRQLGKAGVPDDKIDEFMQSKDGLANLQLLQGNENTEKSASMPSEWLKSAFSDPINRQDYQDLHLLGEVPTSITEFDAFYKARRERLKSEIAKLLGRQPTTSTTAD